MIKWGNYRIAPEKGEEVVIYDTWLGTLSKDRAVVDIYSGNVEMERNTPWRDENIFWCYASEFNFPSEVKNDSR